MTGGEGVQRARERRVGLRGREVGCYERVRRCVVKEGGGYVV